MTILSHIVFLTGLHPFANKEQNILIVVLQYSTNLYLIVWHKSNTFNNL